MSHYHTIALIVAGGKGLRFDGNRPKQYEQLHGKAILRHTVERFLHHSLVDAVAVVIHPSHRPLYENSIKGLELLPAINGGNERKDSVRHGLEALSAYHPDKILIHDAARPFISDDIIRAVIESTKPGQAAAPILPIEDTIKQVEGQNICATIDRHPLRRIQTPQGFVFNEILDLHEQYKNTFTMTDDVALFEEEGKPVIGVHGSKYNIKITDKEDMQMASRIMTQEPCEYEYRTGQGFDVHAFCAPKQQDNNLIRLCGVDVSYEKNLKGHSDADVGLHALTDAILGAIAAEDIGYHFPPSDNSFKDMDSATFVEKAKTLVAEKGGKIANIDITFICERPKIGMHRDAMRARVASLLDITIDRVSIKATTTEKLGFTGRKEGIAAQAVATIKIPITT